MARFFFALISVQLLRPHLRSFEVSRNFSNWLNLTTLQLMKKNNELRPTQPVDQTLISDLNERDEEIDWSRPLYECQVCREQGESNLHKYLDDCHYFDENAFLEKRDGKQPAEK